MENTLKKEPSLRNSNIEYLRIISMLLIIAYHAERAFHALSYPSEAARLYVYLCIQFIASWGILGVDLFLITSAWFLVDQKFRITKLLNIVLQAFSWILVFSVLSVAYDFRNTGSLSAALYSYFDWFITAGITHPFWTKTYWFVTAYLLMLLASPLLNRVINTASKTQLEKVLLLLLFIPILSQSGTGSVNDVAYFCYLYLLVGYLKRYARPALERVAKPAVFLILPGITMLVRLLTFFNISPLPFGIVPKVSEMVFAGYRHTFVMLVDAILIFFWVITKKPHYHKTANLLASCTLGVYLFHENVFAGFPNVLDSIFNKLLSLGFIRVSVLFPVQYLLAVLLVFFLGTGLEYLRLTVIHKPVMKFAEKKCSKKFQKIDSWMNNL